MKKLFPPLLHLIENEIDEVMSRLKEKLLPLEGFLGEDLLQQEELLIPPGLVLLTAHVYNNKEKGILPAFFTLLINVSSCLHNATHAREGRERQLMVLAGDYVCAYLFQLLCESGCFFLLERFARLISVMNEGSAVLEMLKRGDLPLQSDVSAALIDGVRRRYGVFFGECCSLGGLFAGGKEEEQERLYSFGVKLGISYGIQKLKIVSVPSEEQMRIGDGGVLEAFAEELLSLV